MIMGPLEGPGHCRPNLIHMRHCGSVASHFMRFFLHVEQAFVLGGIFDRVRRGADVGRAAC
jgi:hypothetical protein